jgi:uncharacterized membrane protein
MMPAPAPCGPFGFRRWVAVAAASVVVLVLAVLPPFVGPPLRAALMHGFHLVCHQLPGRSFAVDGIPFALCHRCIGLVSGLTAGVLLVPPLARLRATLLPFERPMLLLALALLAADWLLGVGGVWANTPASRFLTGLAVGLVAGYLLARSAAAPEAMPEARPFRSVSVAAP